MRHSYLLPRKNLQEKNFREFVPHLLRAAQGETLIDPRPYKVSTWMSKFRDARRAFQLYNYEAPELVGWDISKVACYPTNGGHVMIRPEPLSPDKGLAARPTMPVLAGNLRSNVLPWESLAHFRAAVAKRDSRALVFQFRSLEQMSAALDEIAGEVTVTKDTSAMRIIVV